jgi:hypothetical protein
MTETDNLAAYVLVVTSRDAELCLSLVQGTTESWGTAVYVAIPNSCLAIAGVRSASAPIGAAQLFTELAGSGDYGRFMKGVDHRCAPSGR